MRPPSHTHTHTHTTLLQHLGVDVDKLLLCQPDSGEMALEVADSLIRRAGCAGAS